MSKRLEKNSAELCMSICKKCGGKIRESKAFRPRLCGSTDFGGDFGEVGTTWSEGSANKPPQPCYKCVECGHSFI